MGIDVFHGIFSLGNWRALEVYITMLPADWSISTSRHFCPPFSMVKDADAMGSIYMLTVSIFYQKIQ